MGHHHQCTAVNAALTIRLFFGNSHALNAALFNRLVGMDTPRLLGHSSGGGGAVPNMCSRQWGMALARRLKRLEAWAERQGLELAADCHLARVMQAAHLLQSPKQTAEQLIETAQSCFKLNSLQLRALLERYHGDGGQQQQQQIPAQLISHIVRVAETTSDELQLADGRQLRLDEDSPLQVPFLLPDDGYSCDVMRVVPQGLHEVTTAAGGTLDDLHGSRRRRRSCCRRYDATATDGDATTATSTSIGRWWSSRSSAAATGIAIAAAAQGERSLQGERRASSNSASTSNRQEEEEEMSKVNCLFDETGSGKGKMKILKYLLLHLLDYSTYNLR